MSDVPDSADLNLSKEGTEFFKAEPVETIPGSTDVTCRQCGGSGYGPDGGKPCEACEGNGVVPGDAPVRDEEYFEHGHSSPHNPISEGWEEIVRDAIPDNADPELLSEPDQSGTAEPVETTSDSAGRKEYPARTMADDLADLAGAQLARIEVDASAKLNLLCPHCKRTGTGPMGETGPEWDEEADVRKVIPVAPGSKYVILIPTGTATETLTKLQDILADWWQSDDMPFLVVGDQFEFVKVDDAAKAPPLASCGYEKCPGHEPDSGDVCGELGDVTVT